jgi:predicted O-methyltransferase YrrM
VWFDRDVKPIWDRLLCDYDATWSSLGRWPTTYLEIGVAEGASMLWVLANLPIERAVGVDPYIPHRKKLAKEYERHRINATNNLGPYIGNRVTMEYEPSHLYLSQAVANLRAAEFDLIYVDGSHYGPDALLDMQLSWILLSVGGVMIIDDVHRRWFHGRPQVREAMRAFEDVYENRYQWLYRRPHQNAVVKLK